MSNSEMVDRARPFFDAWRNKFGMEDYRGIVGLGFISREKFAEETADGAKWLEVTDAELIEFTRATWKHKPDWRCNPSAENTMCIVIMWF